MKQQDGAILKEEVSEGDRLRCGRLDGHPRGKLRGEMEKSSSIWKKC